MMTPPGNEAVLDAILWRCDAVGTALSTPFAMPDVPFTPPNPPATYLSFGVVFNTRVGTIAYDSDVLTSGLLQVNVVCPAQVGLKKPLQPVDQVVSAFGRGNHIARNSIVVRLEEEPDVAASVLTSTWVTVPVIVRWRAVTPRI